VIESGKPVHDTLGWRQDLDSQITHRLLTPGANQVIADGQRPWWKFEGIRTCLVDEMPTRLTQESKSLQYALKVALACRGYKIEVARFIQSPRIDLHGSAA
jgi:hypothetical protein